MNAERALIAQEFFLPNDMRFRLNNVIVTQPESTTVQYFLHNRTCYKLNGEIKGWTGYGAVLVLAHPLLDEIDPAWHDFIYEREWLPEVEQLGRDFPSEDVDLQDAFNSMMESVYRSNQVVHLFGEIFASKTDIGMRKPEHDPLLWGIWHVCSISHGGYFSSLLTTLKTGYEYPKRKIYHKEILRAVWRWYESNH